MIREHREEKKLKIYNHLSLFSRINPIKPKTSLEKVKISRDEINFYQQIKMTVTASPSLSYCFNTNCPRSEPSDCDD